jgi:SAM-dependent methyltransferase/uncharacterized protein YbaR (Trm112 family)
MKLDLLNYLQCPVDGCEDLRLREAKVEPRPGQTEILEGALSCPKCGRSFPVTEGIPCLLPDGATVQASGGDEDYGLKEKRLRDAEAPYYEDLFTPFQNMVELPLFTRHLRVGPDDVVLDLGCGTGRLTRMLYRRAARVIALDFAWEALVALRRSLQAAGRAKVDLVQASATCLPLRPHSVDAVASAQVLTHIPHDREAALAGMAVALKPGGRFACTVHNCSRRVAREFPTGERLGESVYMKFFRPDELARELAPYLRVERVFPVACREGRLADRDWVGLLAERLLEKTRWGQPTARLLFSAGTAPVALKPRGLRRQVAGSETAEAQDYRQASGNDR